MRIMLCQCESLGGDVEVNVERLTGFIAAAAAGDVDLVIAPEMFLSGYNIGPAAAARLAEPVDGPTHRRISAIAAEHRVAVIYGFPELSGDDSDIGESVYNAVRFVDRDGATLTVHRKTHLFGALDREMVAESHERGTVVDFEGWRIGLAICYEVEFAELVRGLAVDGADLVCVPTANMAEFSVVQTVLLPARALENQVFVAYANYCGDDDGLLYGGLSTVTGPGGDVVVRAGTGPETVIAEIDRDELDKSRETFPYLLDRRPELY